MHHQGFRRSNHINEPLSSALPTLKDATEDKRFRSIFEQAAVGMAYMDGDGHLQHMNLHFCGDFWIRTRGIVAARIFSDD